MPKSKYFSNGDSPMSDIAKMLIDLDNTCHLPVAMQESIRSHVDNELALLPCRLGSVARAMHSAITSSGICEDDTTNLVCEIASMADRLRGALDLQSHFDFKKSQA